MAPGVDNVSANRKQKSLLCKKDELRRGEMKEIILQEKDHRLLLVRNEDDSYCAFGHKCPHYGAPLVDGIMQNGRIRCSRHGACFNSKTGDIEDFPGLDSLPKYQVSIEGDDVVLYSEENDFQIDKRIKPMQTSSCTNMRVVIIGGGASALTCSEAMRQDGYDGRITIISKGQTLPYDRPIITKDLTARLEDLYLRDDSFYESHHIDFKLKKEVVGVDVEEKIVRCSDGDNFGYDKLLIASGLSVSKLSIPGGHLQNIYYVASPATANTVAEKAQGKDVVVIGGSFIGMEVACFLVEICKSVTVCCKNSVPFEAAFGQLVGKGLQELHESHSVRFYTNNAVVKILGSSTVEGVELADGSIVEASLVVAGIGTSIATKFLLESGLEMTEGGLLTVDKYLRTSAKDVYASGAAVQFPLSSYGNKLTNVEHWQMAHYHGRIAGLNMHSSLKHDHGVLKEVDSVPFFFTEQYGVELQYAGFGEEHDDVQIYGEVSKGKFCAFYLKFGTVVAAAAMQKGNIVAFIAEKLYAGDIVSKKEVDNLVVAFNL